MDCSCSDVWWKYLFGGNGCFTLLPLSVLGWLIGVEAETTKFGKPSNVPRVAAISVAIVSNGKYWNGLNSPCLPASMFWFSTSITCRWKLPLLSMPNVSFVHCGFPTFEFFVWASLSNFKYGYIIHTAAILASVHSKIACQNDEFHVFLRVASIVRWGICCQHVPRFWMSISIEANALRVGIRHVKKDLRLPL